MNIINKSSVVGLALISVMILSSCSDDTYSNAYDFRNKAAGVIGLEEAKTTVWNDDTPLELGRIYYKFGNRQDGYALKSYSGIYVKSIGDKNVSSAEPDGSSWEKEITESNKIDLQLGYMGLSALAGANVVKKISFSLHGDTKAEVMASDQLYPILNDPNNGPTLRTTVLEDTKRLPKNRKNNLAATYWIVLEVHTAKDLTISLHEETGFTGKLDTSDVAKVASWIKIPNLAFPTVTINPDHTEDTVIKAPDSFGWVAMCVPLLTDDNGHMYIDYSTVLWAASSLHH